jgi:hypothetical protein
MVRGGSPAALGQAVDRREVQSSLLTAPHLTLPRFVNRIDLQVIDCLLDAPPS